MPDKFSHNRSLVLGTGCDHLWTDGSLPVHKNKFWIPLPQMWCTYLYNVCLRKEKITFSSFEKDATLPSGIYSLVWMKAKLSVH